MDLTALRVIAAKDIDQAAARGAKEILTRQGAVITPRPPMPCGRRALTLRHADGPAAAARASQAAQASPEGARRVSRRQDLFNSPEAEPIKAEIVATGKKLWRRQFVDGNGGNISFRIGPNEVLCTPTLCSKADLRPDHISLVDLEGNELMGTRPHERDLPPPRDLQGPAQGQGRGALPSAARDGVRDHGPRAALGHRARVRRVRGDVASRRTRRPAPRSSPRRCCPSSRTTTPCCSATTASSAGPTP